MSTSIRIISGRLRGRTLTVADVPHLRPTPNRVRETLFNWLQFSVQNAVCLDCFAGTGALGFEAYSRGAKEIIFVEQNSCAAQLLIEHAQKWDLEPYTRIILGDALTFIPECAAKNLKFDVVFLDPPFQSDALTKILPILFAVLNPSAYVYVETAKDAPFSLPANFTLQKEKTAGQVTYRLLQWTA